MRYVLAFLLMLFAPPAFAQMSGGTQPDTLTAGQLDLSTAGSTYTMAVANGQGVACLDVVGLTGSGATIITERTAGGTWTTANMLVAGTGGAFTMSLTSDAAYCITTAARRAIRLRVTIAGTGTATITSSASSNSSLTQMTAPLPAGTNTIGTVGLSDGSAVVVSNLLNPQPVSVSSLPTPVAVSGTFWQATQPISVVALPLPTGAATAANQTTLSGQFPATLGAKTTAQSLSVTLPSDLGTLAVASRGAGAIASGQATVGTTAALVAAARTGRQRIVLTPIGTTGYYVGGAGVTTSTGSYVGSGGSMTIDTSAAVYAVVASGTVVVSYLESY